MLFQAGGDVSGSCVQGILYDADVHNDPFKISCVGLNFFHFQAV